VLLTTSFYDAVEQVEKKTSESGLEVWKRAMAT
jgi:small subunit ribosomal protein S7